MREKTSLVLLSLRPRHRLDLVYIHLADVSAFVKFDLCDVCFVSNWRNSEAILSSLNPSVVLPELIKKERKIFDVWNAEGISVYSWPLFAVKHPKLLNPSYKSY